MKVDIYISEPMGRILVVTLVATAIGLVGLIAGSPVLSFVALTLGGGCLIAMWALSGGEPRCQGEVRMHSSESGEVLVGICEGCGRWHLIVRDSPVNNGKGLDSFLEATEEIAAVYERAVPEIAAELRQLAMQLQPEDPPEQEA